MTQKILCVGLVCIDIVQVCKNFPHEDSDQRSLECHWSRGGNASNNCTVLSLLDAECEFFGTVADNLFWRYVKENFGSYNIDTSNCIIHDAHYEFPLSTVIVNAENASRTIIHSNKNLPGITAAEFSTIDLSNYCWIHFEGRNPSELLKILEIAKERTLGSGINISVELEKKREGLLELANHAEIIFISKDFAVDHGWNDMETAIEGMKKHVQAGSTIICPWSELGAAAYEDSVGLVQSPSYPPPRIVDTLGAGDTFLAATIYSLSRKEPLQRAIDFGCRMAGAKVGGRGFDMVKDAFINATKQM